MGMLIMIAVSIIGAIIIAHIMQYVGDLFEKRRPPAKMRLVHTPGLLFLAVVLSPIMFIALVSGVLSSPTSILGVARDFLIFGGTTLISLFVADRLIAQM